MHFLKESERNGYDVHRHRAGVTVRFEKAGKERVLVLRVPEDDEPCIAVARLGTSFARLPDDVKVLDPDTRKPIKASHQFWVSLGTLDPFHFLLDTDEP